MNSNQDPASPTLRPETDSDRLLADWLASEAPDREPPVLLPAVLARTALTRRRPAWRIPDWWLRRTSPRSTAGTRSDRTMFSTLKLISAGAIVALASGYLLSGVTVTPTPPPPAAPASHVVALDGSGDFASISEAVAAAAEGDTILVRPGTYSESIVIDKSITLTGDGEREAIVITTPPEGPDAIVDPPNLDWRYAMLLQESDAMVSGLTFRGDWAGVLVRGGSPTLAGLHVDHAGSPYGSTLPGLGSSIDIVDGSTATVRDSLFTVTQNLGVDGDSSPTIEDNVLEGGTHIYLLDAGDDAVVRGNTISGTYSWAIFVNGPTTMLIEGNTITSSTGNGIVIGYGMSPGRDPVIRGNTISGTREGITVSRGARPLIEANTITDAWNGISSYMGDPVIEGNTISGGTGGGLLLNEGAPTISGNVVEGMRLGLFVMAKTLPALEGNTFCGNEDNVKFVSDGQEQTVTELPGNEVCPDGLVTAAGG